MVVEVVYALPHEQLITQVALDSPVSVRDAIELSGLLEKYAEIDLSRVAIGIFGKIVTLETLVRDGDRVEIYRALESDPKDRRSRRARAMGTR